MTTRWLRRSIAGARQPDHDIPPEADPAGEPLLFVCSTCGRPDLPEAGGWDPPICEECDAAINEDAIREELDDGGR